MDTYRATNTTNGKFYIGSSTNFEKRKKEHLSSKENYPFQNALRKNPDAFEWEVWSDDSNEPILEQALLDMWYGKECCYNLNPSAKHPPRNKEASARGGRSAMIRLNKKKDSQGKSVIAVAAAKKAHSQKDEKGRSVLGVKNAERMHSEKNEEGKSLVAIRINQKIHALKNSEGKSINAIKASQRAHAEKDEKGRSLHGVKSAERLHSVKWEDPDHPELGHQNPANLIRMQKSRGLPHGKENRRKVEG